MEQQETPQQISKTEQLLEAAMERHAGDPARAAVLERAKRFKRSWIELAEALVNVRTERLYQKWGHSTFDDYCQRELHIRKATAEKLCVSFGFLQANAPRLVDERLERAEGGAPVKERPIPSLQAVDFLARAESRGAAEPQVMQEMRKAVFDDGASAPALARKYKEVAFPVPDDEMRARVRMQIMAVARRLAALVAEPSADLPGDLAERVEEVAGEIVETLGESVPAHAAAA